MAIASGIRGRVIPLAAVWLAAILLTAGFARFESIALKPSVVWTALTLDLVVALPALFYFLLLRPLRWPSVLAVPAAALGFLMASRFVPAEYAATLEALKLVAAPAEIAIVIWVIIRTKKAFRTKIFVDADPVDGFQAAARELVHAPRAASILASELAVLYYGLYFRPHNSVPKGFVPVPAYVRSGHGGLAFATIAILALEGVAVHAFLSRWSDGAAWVLTAATAYAGLWVWADFRAARYRPTVVGPDSVVFRAGLRWEVEVPKSLIRSIGSATEAQPQERLSFCFLGEPSVWVDLTEPVSVRGLYGIERRAQAIGLDPDGPLAPTL